MIPQDHYYVHADHADSHDSRYEEIGLIPLERIRGRALALPDVPWLGLKGPLARPRGRGHEAASSPIPFAVRRDCIRVDAHGGSRDGEGSRRARRGMAHHGTRPAARYRGQTQGDGNYGRTRPHESCEALARARSASRRPRRVSGVVPARERRTRLFDPSVTLEEDVRAADGTLLAAKGARVNPLTTHPLTRDLLFIDGTRPVEVAWALRHEKPSVIVLLAGRPLDLTRAHGRAFFYDQGGRLTRRFGLLATPSVVKAAGSALKITEVPLEDEPDPLGEGDRP